MDDGIEIKVFDAVGTLVFSKWCTTEQWYDEKHPLIDDEPAVRVKYRARVAEGADWMNGIITRKWRVLYSEEGEFDKDYVWKDGIGWEEFTVDV